jgi:cytochrome c biogenesis protein CcmG/thiol:disulfide interchange protein DsbE
VLAVVALGAYAFLRPGPASPTGTEKVSLAPAEVGRIAPPFTLTTLDGERVSLSDFRGHIVILDFWASWCPPCKAEIPDFIALQNHYGPSGLQVLGVALEDEHPARAYAHNAGMNYPVLLGDEEISAAYGGVTSLPTTLIIDGRGTIIAKYVGFREKRVFEDEIRKLLAV